MSADTKQITYSVWLDEDTQPFTVLKLELLNTLENIIDEQGDENYKVSFKKQDKTMSQNELDAMPEWSGP